MTVVVVVWALLEVAEGKWRLKARDSSCARRNDTLIRTIQNVLRGISMRFCDFKAVAALLSVSFAAQAAAPGYITSVVAGTPDPNKKVPAFNAVSGAGTGTFSEATPEAILEHGNSYEVCITLQNGNVSASTTWAYKITQRIAGTNTTVQRATIAKNAKLSGNGLYAYCFTSVAIPDSPGASTLTGTVVYDTSPKATILLNVPIALN